MTRTIFAAAFFAGIAASTATAQAPAQSAAAKECLRTDGSSIEGVDFDARERARYVWIDFCRNALAEDPGNLRLKQVLSRALQTVGKREEAIVMLRELAAQNDANAAFEIYDMYKSYYRNDVNAPQLVKREEAEQMLRKAAELGHTYATLMLAVLLDRGSTVKRNNTEAIVWARRALANPDKDSSPADMQVLVGRLLVKSDKPEERANGIDILDMMSQRRRGDAQAHLATAIRADDPVRARKLLENAPRGFEGAVVPVLADMLTKGEGGPADVKRAWTLLRGRGMSDAPTILGPRGVALIEGKLVPRDVKEGVKLLSIWASWNIDARLQLMGVLATNPEITVFRPEGMLYDATEAAELGEPGALMALIDLKLSQSAQFKDKPAAARWRKPPPSAVT